MSAKGSRHTEQTARAKEYLETQLDQIEGITTKKMFGGYGFFHDGKIFGVVSSKGIPYFRVDESNRQKYIDLGSEQFFTMKYFSVPDQILDNSDQLAHWASESIELSKK